MPPEHEQLEADWLAGELDRCRGFAREAYKAHDDDQKRLYLANLIGTMDSLYAHFKPIEDVQYQPQQPDNRGWFGFKKQ